MYGQYSYSHEHGCSEWNAWSIWVRYFPSCVKLCSRHCLKIFSVMFFLDFPEILLPSDDFIFHIFETIVLLTAPVSAVLIFSKSFTRVWIPISVFRFVKLCLTKKSVWYETQNNSGHFSLLCLSQSRHCTLFTGEFLRNWSVCDNQNWKRGKYSHICIYGVGGSFA
jgi:hypothetical protein